MTVTQVFTGDTKDLEKAYLRLEQQNRKMMDAIKGLHESTKESSNAGLEMLAKMGEGFAEQSKGIAGSIAGLFSLDKALDFVRESFSEWREEMRQFGQEQLAFAATIAKTIGATTSIVHAPAVERLTRETRYATREETAQAYQSIRQTNTTMDQKRAEELTKHVAELAPLGDVTQLGKTAGQLDQLFPKKSGEEIAGLALKLQQLTGGSADQLTGDSMQRALKLLKAQGMDEEKSLALGVTALQQNLSPKLLETLAAQVDEQPKYVRTAGKRPTEEDRINNQLAATKSPQERLQLVLTDRKVADHVLGAKGAAELQQLLSAQQTEANRQEIAASKTYATEQTRLGERDKGDLGREYRAREAEKQKMTAQREEREKAGEGAIRSQQIESQLAEMQPLERSATKGALGLNSFLKWLNVVGDESRTVDRQLGSRQWHELRRTMPSASRQERLDEMKRRGFELGPGFTGWRMVEGEEGHAPTLPGPHAAAGHADNRPFWQRLDGPAPRQPLEAAAERGAIQPQELHRGAYRGENQVVELPVERGAYRGKRMIDDGSEREQPTKQLIELQRQNNRLVAQQTGEIRRAGSRTPINAHNE